MTLSTSRKGQNVVNSQIGLSFAARIAEAVLFSSQALGIEAPPYAADIASNLAPFNLATDDPTVWAIAKNLTRKESDMFALYPIWPSEALSSASEEKQLAIARATSRAYSDFSRGRPVELFPAAVRAGAGDGGWTPQEVVDGLNAYLGHTFGPNLLPYTNGGGIENVGVTRAVNEMLVVNEGSAGIRLFPMWNRTEPASFARLRVKGAFEVSAAWTPSVGVESPVRIASDVESSCLVSNPWADFSPGNVSVISASSGLPTEVQYHGDVFSFAAASGEVYEVRPLTPRPYAEPDLLFV